MGGWVPLGYDRKERTLTVNETEAETVRTIFDLFLRLKNVREVQAELVRLKLKTKPYAVQRGRATGNLPFARGHIYKILSNPLYIGEIEHKGVRYPGQHPPLIDSATWDAVQAQLVANITKIGPGPMRRARACSRDLSTTKPATGLFPATRPRTANAIDITSHPKVLGARASSLPKLRLPAATMIGLSLPGRRIPEGQRQNFCISARGPAPSGTAGTWP